jgi:hypothetical protein
MARRRVVEAPTATRVAADGVEFITCFVKSDIKFHTYKVPASVGAVRLFKNSIVRIQPAENAKPEDVERARQVLIESGALAVKVLPTPRDSTVTIKDATEALRSIDEGRRHLEVEKLVVKMASKTSLGPEMRSRLVELCKQLLADSQEGGE